MEVSCCPKLGENVELPSVVRCDRVVETPCHRNAETKKMTRRRNLTYLGTPKKLKWERCCALIKENSWGLSSSKAAVASPTVGVRAWDRGSGVAEEERKSRSKKEEWLSQEGSESHAATGDTAGKRGNLKGH